jgi:hypothetical protein
MNLVYRVIASIGQQCIAGSFGARGPEAQAETETPDSVYIYTRIAYRQIE